MIKRPAQHTALTFLRLSKLSVAFLLLMIVLYPLMMILGIAVKVGIVLGLHFLVEKLFGSWIVLFVFSILTFLFLAFSFLSRVKELGRYYVGLHQIRLSVGQRIWYKIVFAIDFLVTDMLTLTASFLLAYVYWLSAALHSYAPFYVYLQPFLALSILGGLLQILFSSYYLTHDKLHPVYVNAIGAGKTYDRITAPQKLVEPAKPMKLRKSSRKSSKKKSTSKKTARKSSSKSAAKKSTKRKSSQKKSSRRR